MIHVISSMNRHLYEDAIDTHFGWGEGIGGVSALKITGTIGTAMPGFKKCNGKNVAWSKSN